LPRFQQILDKYKSQGFSVVTINVVADEDSDGVELMLKGRYHFTDALTTPDKTVFDTYSVKNYLLDSDGRVIFVQEGVVTPEKQRDLEEKIQLVLARATSRKTSSTLSREPPAQGK
jgi:hypothetical protein